MMCYFAKLEPDNDGLLVTFPDIPEAMSAGSTRPEALENAREALEVALLTYAAHGRALPPPAHESDMPVEIGAAASVKIAFIQAFLDSGMTRVALARKLGKQEGEVRRMLDPYHRTKLATMEAGLQALGKRLVITVKNAA